MKDAHHKRLWRWSWWERNSPDARNERARLKREAEEEIRVTDNAKQAEVDYEWDRQQDEITLSDLEAMAVEP